MLLPREHITGVVLAGGRGSRMGGLDKGLRPWHGRPLARCMLDRLAPQVGPLMVSANRHLDDYRSFGVPVCSDASPDFRGPLAGLVAGLAHCRTPYLVSVPCDVPAFPCDLVARLADALQRTAGARIAIASVAIAGEAPRLQPVFALLDVALEPSLRDFVDSGGAKVREWMALHRPVEAMFEDPAAFANINTLDDLRRAEGGR